MRLADYLCLIVPRVFLPFCLDLPLRLPVGRQEQGHRQTKTRAGLISKRFFKDFVQPKFTFKRRIKCYNYMLDLPYVTDA